ncbi:PREDICTED: uncharacterized protein LOC107074065 [Polistes dominula]|uniref:Uncharacterized protein LOC107074065 n=1 Tax=Polistes dominula TaxID=743375 RepID=A0ABM1JDN6_POLDO|nr:PREDICTED: uncharacterized protein LOC107074065 [Polistes dominula]
MKMFRVLIISTLICLGLANSIVERNSSFQSTQESGQQSQQLTVAQNQNNNQLQMNSYLQESLLPPRQYLYPSFPDYSNNRGDQIQSRVDEHQSPISSQENHDWPFVFSQGLIPLATSLMLYGSQFWSVFAYFALGLVVVSVIITLICTFTNICLINLSDFPLYNTRVKEQVTDLARTYITPESLNAATVYILDAYNKYHALQRKKRDQ